MTCIVTLSKPYNISPNTANGIMISNDCNMRFNHIGVCPTTPNSSAMSIDCNLRFIRFPIRFLTMISIMYRTSAVPKLHCVFLCLSYDKVINEYIDVWNYHNTIR